jgi:hypothetical protein
VASVFISHSSSARDAAQRLEERLQAEGFGELFIDFDPEQGIPAGRNWEREFYAQLRKTDALIFLMRRAIEDGRSSLRMRSELERLATDWEQADPINETITKRPAGCSGGQRG